ncbi:MAG: HmuY family protein [Ectothiorhodospiraceae bacterium]|nr:HmuY family protein [Ectothiorhodospiraceae bacterium]MCH8505414.1 hypothetical protein [Ectothiorhodospiraceae bacterium]
MKTGKGLTAITAASALLLAGCFGSSSSSSSGGGGGGDNPPDGEVQTRQFDASDADDYVYFDLVNEELLELTDEQALESDAWHIAFRRNYLKLNGGTSGPGSVRGALVAAQEHFYESNGEPNPSVFLNASPESELNPLLDDFDEPANSDWINDSITTVLSGPSSTDGGWYIYEGATGHFLANPDNGWLLRSGEGNSYARMRMTDLVFHSRSGNGVESFTFEFDVQVPDTSQFTTEATFTGSIPGSGGDVCFDFDTDATVDCTGTAWDLKIGFQGRDFYLRSNGGVSGDGDGAAFGPFPWSELSAFTSATTEPGGTSIAGLYVPDSSGGVFDAHEWYGYNLSGQHRLWPNYRVYLVDTDSADDASPRFALQLINYYTATGASGHPQIRWRPVE